MEKNQDLSAREIGNYVIPLYAFVKKSIFTFPQDKGNHVVPVSSDSGMVYISLATVHWKGALTQWLVHSKKRVASCRSVTENFSLPIQQMDA